MVAAIGKFKTPVFVLDALKVIAAAVPAQIVLKFRFTFRLV
jgi:hypothetical protein